MREGADRSPNEQEASQRARGSDRTTHNLHFECCYYSAIGRNRQTVPRPTLASNAHPYPPPPRASTLISAATSRLMVRAQTSNHTPPYPRPQGLHFECCYYSAIDEAIERGLPRVEAGAQGEHKIQRGYMPNYTYRRATVFAGACVARAGVRASPLAGPRPRAAPLPPAPPPTTTPPAPTTAGTRC